jgi:hypothetical protein
LIRDCREAAGGNRESQGSTGGASEAIHDISALVMTGKGRLRWFDALRLTLATQLAAALNRSPAERAKIVRGLVETVMVEEKTITIKVRAGALFHRLPCSSEISFEAEIDPTQVRICHCTDCQTRTGTAFRTTVPSLPGTFVLRSGTPKIYIKTAESGNKRAHAFCSECGTPL